MITLMNSVTFHPATPSSRHFNIFNTLVYDYLPARVM